MDSSGVKFEHFTHEHYQQVCDFLIELNREQKTHINWNWARFEWMYSHPYFDRDSMNTIGLWLSEDAVVGAAIYDMYFGEAFCAALPAYRNLLPEIIDYACRELGDDGGLGIAVNDEDEQTAELLLSLGFRKAEQTEDIMRLELQPMEYTLPDGYHIRQLCFPSDELAYQTVIWKGFDHEGDMEELERMLNNKAPSFAHRITELCLAVVDENDEFAAHCTCWYDPATDYTYVEPVCTVPAHRGRGLAGALVREVLGRCRRLGASQAFVISDQMFYKKLGFEQHSHYTFYWKN